MSNETDSYGEWLKTELRLFETYQNHKETMAWTATALFLAGGAAFVFSVPDFAIANQWPASLCIFLATAALFVFLLMQFKKRWDGADTQEGIRFALARLYLKAEADKLNFEPSEEDPAPGLPKFVIDEIAKVKLRKPRRLGRNDLRWRSELSSYFFVFLVMVVMLFTVWIAPTSNVLKMNELVKGITLLSRQADQEAAQLRDQLAATSMRLEKRLEKIENLLIALSAPTPPRSGKTEARPK